MSMKRLLLTTALLVTSHAMAGFVTLPLPFDSSLDPLRGIQPQLDGTTNTVVIAGTNAYGSYIAPKTTNFYNFPSMVMSGSGILTNTLYPYNTNFYPAFVFAIHYGYPYSGQFLPIVSALTYTNAATTYYFAAGDGYIWITNYFSIIVSGVASAIVTTNGMTNFLSATAIPWPYLALTRIENPGASTTSNQWLRGLIP